MDKRSSAYASTCHAYRKERHGQTHGPDGPKSSRCRSRHDHPRSPDGHSTALGHLQATHDAKTTETNLVTQPSRCNSILIAGGQVAARWSASPCKVTSSHAVNFTHFPSCIDVGYSGGRRFQKRRSPTRPDRVGLLRGRSLLLMGGLFGVRRFEFGKAGPLAGRRRPDHQLQPGHQCPDGCRDYPIGAR